MVTFHTAVGILGQFRTDKWSICKSIAHRAASASSSASATGSMAGNPKLARTTYKHMCFCFYMQ